MHSQDPHKPHLPTRAPQAPARPRHAHRPRMRRVKLLGTTLRGLLKRRPVKLGVMISGGAVGALVLALVAVNLILSADWVTSRVAARIKEQTGRDLIVNGTTMLLFTPGPHVVITDATITDPDATAGTADLSVAKLTLDLNFRELLSSQVDAERVVLTRPVLTIRLGDDAMPLRWGKNDEHPDRGAKNIRFAKAQAGGSLNPRRDVRLKDVRIKNGAVVIVYDDKDARSKKRVEHINAQLSLPTIADPLSGHGRFEWKDQRVDFSVEVTTPAELRAARPARLFVALDTHAIAARFDGSLTTKPQLTGQGKLSAKASSIPSVLAWMREKPAMATGIGDGELASDVSWTKGEIAFSHARFALEHAAGQGQAVVALKSPRPHVRAAFALDHLDLNPFLADPAKMPKKKKKKKAAAAPKDNVPMADTPAPARAPSGPKDWFSTPAPAPTQVEAIVVPSPSGLGAEASVRLSSPAAFDADVNLNIRKSRVGHLDIGPSSLGLVFRDGVMNATLGGMQLYGGRASGTLMVDASKPIPAFTGDFRLDGVEALPLLSDAAQFTMLAGRTKLNLRLSGEGDDAEAIKASLHGQGSVVVSDGSIAGIDVTALISGLGEGDFNLRQGPDAKTAFRDLGGSFTIANGIAETRNLKMVSPLLKVTAEGTVDLARSNLDILAHPEIVAGPEGKGGANDLAGLTVPVRIEGPLEDPRFKPQIGGVFANPDGASKTVNKIGEALQKKFKGKPVGEAIGRFLGNVQIGGSGGGNQATKRAPQALAPPQAPEPDQGDADEALDPDLEEILR